MSVIILVTTSDAMSVSACATSTRDATYPDIDAATSAHRERMDTKLMDWASPVMSAMGVIASQNRVAMPLNARMLRGVRMLMAMGLLCCVCEPSCAVFACVVGPGAACALVALVECVVL